MHQTQNTSRKHEDLDGNQQSGTKLCGYYQKNNKICVWHGFSLTHIYTFHCNKGKRIFGVTSDENVAWKSWWCTCLGMHQTPWLITEDDSYTVVRQYGWWLLAHSCPAPPWLHTPWLPHAGRQRATYFKTWNPQTSSSSMQTAKQSCRWHLVLAHDVMSHHRIIA